jgi:hypothetical protein
MGDVTENLDECGPLVSGNHDGFGHFDGAARIMALVRRCMLTLGSQ